MIERRRDSAKAGDSARAAVARRRGLVSVESTGLLSGVALLGALGFGALGGAFERDISRSAYGQAAGRAGGSHASAGQRAPGVAGGVAHGGAMFSVQAGALGEFARAGARAASHGDDAAAAAKLSEASKLTEARTFVARVLRGDFGATYSEAQFAAAQKLLHEAERRGRAVVDAAALPRPKLMDADVERTFFMMRNQDGLRRLGDDAWDGALDAFRAGELDLSKLLDARARRLAADEAEVADQAKRFAGQAEQMLLTLSQERARLEQRLALVGYELVINRATTGEPGVRFLADQGDGRARLLIANRTGANEAPDLIRAKQAVERLGASRLVEIRHHQFDLFISQREGNIRVANDSVNGRFADVPAAAFEKHPTEIADSLIKYFGTHPLDDGSHLTLPKFDDPPPHPRHGP